MTIEELISHTLEYEGGYSNDQHDDGGETNFGICKRQYPSVDIRLLTKSQAIDIYKRDYFDKMNLGLISDSSVQWKLFDIGVNQGQGTAIRMLQQIVGEKEDGLLGIKTANLANTMNVNDLLKALATKQMLRYADIVAKNTTQVGFMKGWIRRGMDY